MDQRERQRITEEETVVRRTPRLSRMILVCYGLGALAAILYLCFLVSERFADWFGGTVGAAVRAALSYLTGWIPFSLAEYLLLLLPVILCVLIAFGIRRYSDSWRGVFVYCGSILGVVALVLSIFTMGFAPGYHGTSLDRKLGIERRDVSAEELYQTAVILSERVNEEADRITFSTATDFSIMPYDIEELNDRLMEAYDAACDRYGFPQRLRSRLKPVMLSEAMSYTHITGVYSFFTGEANLNVAFPDYTLPFTAAHELSHQRGVAREDEANFMAFLVCLESEDAYIRYSGYLNLYEYVSSALYSASPELYAKAGGQVETRVRREMAAFGDFFDQYRDSVASEVTEAVNDTFLTLHGTEGTKSYGMVVDLAVAYYVSD